MKRPKPGEFVVPSRTIDKYSLLLRGIELESLAEIILECKTFIYM